MEARSESNPARELESVASSDWYHDRHDRISFKFVSFLGSFWMCCDVSTCSWSTEPLDPFVFMDGGVVLNSMGLQ